MAVPIAGGLSPPLLGLLADGRLRSGEWLAQALGMSRAAVWKGIERLRAQGIEVEAVPRRGYCLPHAVELLDERVLRAALDKARAERLRHLEVLFDVDSTNTRLLAAPPPPYGSADVVLSELQHAGRGRRGRPWIAPFGGSVALSMGWSFADASRASPSLSLCVGVAVARALARAGALGIALKWPNDIWFGDRKVGGVLIELRAEASGPAHVVIGVGLNVALPPASRALIEASGVRAAAVADACAASPSRNFIAGAIIDELLSAGRARGVRGFSPGLVGAGRARRPPGAGLAGRRQHRRRGAGRRCRRRVAARTSGTHRRIRVRGSEFTFEWG